VANKVFPSSVVALQFLAPLISNVLGLIVIVDDSDITGLDL